MMIPISTVTVLGFLDFRQDGKSNVIGRQCYGFLKVRGCPHLIKEIAAAYAVGAATDAYSDEKYEEAFRVLKPVADLGIVDSYVVTAQYLVGRMFYLGLTGDVERDIGLDYLRRAVGNRSEEAAKLLKATQGDSDPMFVRD